MLEPLCVVRSGETKDARSITSATIPILETSERSHASSAYHRTERGAREFCLHELRARLQHTFNISVLHLPSIATMPYNAVDAMFADLAGHQATPGQPQEQIVPTRTQCTIPRTTHLSLRSLQAKLNSQARLPLGGRTHFEPSEDGVTYHSDRQMTAEARFFVYLHGHLDPEKIWKLVEPWYEESESDFDALHALLLLR